MKTQKFTRYFEATPERVYQCLVDPEMLIQWRAPDGMQMKIHSFEAKVGGKFRISLAYDDKSVEGKSGENLDTYTGYFSELIPNRKVVEVLEFESADGELQGTNTIISELVPEGPGTRLNAIHKNLPEGIPAEANEEGWQMSFDKLARLLVK